MGDNVNYFGTPNNGAAALATASVGYGTSAPTNVAAILTAGVNGTRIEQIRVTITGQIPACVLNLFRYDGTHYWMIDQYTLSAVTLSTTVPFTTYVQPYDRLTLKSGDVLYAGVTVTPTSGSVIVSAFGADS
jgi:hypothetical protein